MKLVVLSDNTAAARETRSEHGLSFWIDTGENRLLFDTGQGQVIGDNARALGVSLDTTERVVLSHGHYDHTGGLAEVLRGVPGRVAVHAHPDALLARYRRADDGPRAIGMPSECRESLFGRCRFSSSKSPLEVVRGIRTTGEILRMHPEEAFTNSFYEDPEGQTPDLFMDDQALCIATEQGTVVLLGCAHAGVINTLDHVVHVTEGAPIRAVIGGMHLGSVTEKRLAWTLYELRRFDIGMLAPMHCTGQKATAALWKAFPGVCREWGAGTSFEC